MGNLRAKEASDVGRYEYPNSVYRISASELYGARTSTYQQTGATVKDARDLVKTLEGALVLMSEDDAVQPEIKDLYAALWEAEVRIGVLEDWHERTYGLPDRNGAMANGN